MRTGLWFDDGDVSFEPKRLEPKWLRYAARLLLLLIHLRLWRNPILSQLGNGDASRLKRVVAELLRGGPWRLGFAAAAKHLQA